MSQKNASQGTQPKLWTKDLVLIILVNLCVFTNHIMSLSTLPFFIQGLGGTEAIAGICAVVFSFVAVIIRPFVGWWLDNGVRRAALVIGLLLLGLAPLGYMFVPTLSLAIALRMLHGVGLSFSNSTTATVASDVICRPRFAEGMGYFGMATALASAIAPALGLELMYGFGYQVLYATAAGIALLGLILFMSIKGPRVDVPHKKLDLRTIINRDSLPATVTMLVFMFTFGALENFVALFASENGLPSGSIYFLVMSAMLLLVRVTLGKLVDEKGEAFFVYSCNVAMLVAFLLLAFVPMTPTFIVSAILMPSAASSRASSPWLCTRQMTQAGALQTPRSSAATISATAWAAASQVRSSRLPATR
jgi:predicted MFS family arabinose efflux permease